VGLGMAGRAAARQLAVQCRVASLERQVCARMASGGAAGPKLATAEPRLELKGHEGSIHRWPPVGCMCGCELMS
jgi:glycine/D-amino acid oxidase-like deaminating enzyme